jgi:hypothetical protein
MADATALGALFLLSLIAPAYVADNQIIAGGPDTPLLVVFGVGAAAGVGALLSLTGDAIWHFFAPYVPGLGLERFRGLPNFRLGVARELGAFWDVTRKTWPEGDRALIATQYLYYRHANSEVREWSRRRHQRFALALSAVAAIGLGLLGDFLLTDRWSPLRIILVVALVLLAVRTILFAARQRADADRMEEYWFALRARELDEPE